ncbi:MAG: helix-turn-helix domain-containing protein [bacterium]|nr:helix-turn-helix domain-containing protein [bacterium]
MKISELTRLLSDLGLNENEANTYIAALPLGPTTIISLSRMTQIKRTTLYTVCDSLQQKGLIRIEERGFKRKFVAESPERLETLLESRKNSLQKALPDLRSLFQPTGGSTLIRYHEGLEATKALYLDLLREVRPGQDYLVIGNQEQWYDLDSGFFRRFIEKRSRLNFKIRCLFTDTETAREHIRQQRQNAQEIRLLPSRTTISTNLVIVPHQVLMHQLTPPVMAMVIQNKSMIQMHRELFEVMWQEAGNNLIE